MEPRFTCIYLLLCSRYIDPVMKGWPTASSSQLPACLCRDHNLRVSVGDLITMKSVDLSWDFFLVHAKGDAAMANELFHLLSKSHRVFLDAHLSIGVDAIAEIDDALHATRTIVVLLSGNFKQSWYGPEEVMTAIHLLRQDPNQRRIVPVYLEGELPDYSNIPYGLRRLKGCVLRPAGGLEEIARALVAVHDGTTTTVSATAASSAGQHTLDDYPYGPMLEGHYVEAMVVNDCAKSFQLPVDQKQIVNEANGFRVSAAHPGERVPLIEWTEIPSPEHNTAKSTWYDIFREARKNGPRTLAALLLTIGSLDNRPLSENFEKARRRTLAKLAALNSSQSAAGKISSG